MNFNNFTIQTILVGVLGVSVLCASFAIINVNALVKITSPAKGQHVAVGNIVISGISSSNSTNRCIVSVKLNGLKPYQQATADGNKGPNDYSNWTFTANQKYTTIKEGMNRITAKYTCPQNANLTKYYSVNVTGVPEKGGILPQPASSNNNNTNVTSGAFPPSLPSVPTQIINETKHSKILK